jgi:hypothetical protein
MSFGIPVRNGLGIGLLPSTAISTLRIGGRPALILNFIGTTSLDSRIGFTRSTTATFVGSNGLIQSAAINAPRFDYDPATLASKGLMIEETRRNLFLNSLIDGTSLSTQTVTVTAVAHTISFYGTGTIILSGASVATVTGTGVYPNRRTLTFTPIAGALVCTVTGSVQYAQIEAGAFATSFIPTAGATVNRATDNAEMIGTNFSSWYNQTQGTFVSSFDKYSVASRGGVLCAGNTAGATGTDIAIDGQNDAKVRAFIENLGAVEMLNATLATYAANTPIKGAVAYATNSAVGAAAGALGTVDTSVVVPTLNALQIGALRNSSAAAIAPLNGHIRSITYYNTRLPNATLQVLTT